MSSLLVDKVLRVPAHKKMDFFRLWVDFLRPYHDLTQRESDLLICLLRCRHQLMKDISNEDFLDSILFTEKIKKQIHKEMGITDKNFNVLISRLKEKKLIIDGKINRRFIPNLKDDAKEFQILILFEFMDE